MTNLWNMISNPLDQFVVRPLFGNFNLGTLLVVCVTCWIFYLLILANKNVFRLYTVVTESILNSLFVCVIILIVMSYLMGFSAIAFVNAMTNFIWLIWLLLPLIVVALIACAVLWLIMNKMTQPEVDNWSLYWPTALLFIMSSVLLLIFFLPGIMMLCHYIWWLILLIMLVWVWSIWKVVSSWTFINWVLESSSTNGFEATPVVFFFKLVYGFLLRVGPAVVDVSYAVTFVTTDFLEDIYNLVRMSNISMSPSLDRSLKTATNVALPNELMNLAYVMARGDSSNFAKLLLYNGEVYRQLYESTSCNKAGRQYMNSVLHASGLNNIFFAYLSSDKYSFASAVSKFEPLVMSYKLEAPVTPLHMVATKYNWAGGLGDVVYFKANLMKPNWNFDKYLNLKSYELKLTSAGASNSMLNIFHQQMKFRGEYLIAHYNLEQALINGNKTANEFASTYIEEVLRDGWGNAGNPHKNLSRYEWFKLYQNSWNLGNTTVVNLAPGGSLTEDDVEDFVTFTRRSSINDYRMVHGRLGSIVSGAQNLPVVQVNRPSLGTLRLLTQSWKALPK